MKNKLIIKGLVFGIILLFIGTSVIPANINTKQNKVVDKNNTSSTIEDTYYNLIGGVNITFDFPGKSTVVKFEWWKATDRNFTYPIINGNVSVNYTFRFQTYSNGLFALPRLAGVVTLGYYPEERQIGTGWAWGIVPFWKHYQGKVKYITVNCDAIPMPPPDPNSTRTTFISWSLATAITIPPTHADNETAHMLYLRGKQIDFWANFTEG